jgi:hypothetical protein
MKKTWCKHIKCYAVWSNYTGYFYGKLFGLYRVNEDWNYCPICGKPRPKQKK